MIGEQSGAVQRRGNLRDISAGGGAERVPPHDLDAEKNVIGAMLVSESVAERVAEMLVPEDFYFETHRVIYRAMLELRGRSQPVDQTTVNDELRRVGEFEKIGGRAYVFGLVESVPMVANAGRYAAIVRDKATLRRLVDTGMRITDDAFREMEDVRAAVEEAERLVYGVSAGLREGSSGGASPMSELALRALEEITARYESGVKPGVSTGFRDLDEKTLGSHPGDLTIIAARPAMGKTSLLVSLAKAAARVEDSHALVFSLEMSEEQLTYRLISQASRIPIPKIMEPDTLSPEEFPRLVSAAADVSGMRILVDDEGSRTVSGMRSRVRRETARLAARGEKLSLVAVDYLQLMSGDSARRSDSRVNEVSEISRGLKLLAREFSVPVVALSQLSRACEQRHDKRPMLSDLRDSGAIEQDADKVLFLYRDEYYDPDTEDRGISEVNVAKHRNGPTGKVRLAWLERTAEFAGLSRAGEVGS